MESIPDPAASQSVAGHVFGFLTNDGAQRYLLEAECSTGFMAWQLADGTILTSDSLQVSLVASRCVTFWPCGGYQDATPAGKIISFDCHGNALTQLDVRGLAGLEYLDCSFNNLQELPLGGLTDLQALDAANNQLADLDVRGLPALRVLNCANNRLNRLDLAGLAALQILDATNNPLLLLDRAGCTSLQEVRVSSKPPTLGE